MFFNVGGYEILVIAVLALIFIGPEQLPTVMRKIVEHGLDQGGPLFQTSSARKR